MKQILKVLGLVALALLIAPQANATIILTDSNSTVLIDPASQDGMYDWKLDGIDVMYQQWFWFRVGNTAEHSIDTIGTPVILQATPNIVQLTYGAGGPLEIQILYALTGGMAGSLTSDVAETIHIINRSTQALDLHFYQYSDFDLSASDIVTIDHSLRFVDQVPAGGGTVLSETVATPSPDHAEANYFSNTRNALNDGLPTTLNGVLKAGPGDMTWAFEWDQVIAAHGSLIISKDKHLAPVPEPAALALFGGILVLLSRKLRRAGA